MSISNAAPKEAIEVEPSMLPLLAQALAIQRNYELMTGHKDAMRLTEALLRDVEARISPASRLFEPGSWAEIGHAIKAGGQSFRLEIKVPEWRNWGTKGWILVTVGDRSWKSSRCEHDPKGPELKQLADALEGIAPAALQPA